ncbi:MULTISPECIES: aromatic ring-hydroxylating oxygenase subunit alpha [Acidiphilium]|uniref:aromatic ring-hydroxylating oxygenase subunit alpha n=1 Tax=Acidiphilium TaxID=522 RepID=UPI001B8C97A2|nr:MULTISPECIES: aromatic ring-hydroxylating dioxygenase subunit alpha [Acidiphilium]MBS3023757.1 aromatic ring-hydroxylating dioxygenase subunit alpha [Acidiphilium multivorum]
MPDTPLRNRLSALLAQRPPRHTLPQAFYTDPEIFEFDLREIYGRSWLLIGLETEIPDPGSYLAMTIGRSPILLLRGQDGVLRGFFNTCRHRGAQILADGCGHAQRLLCPYHQWMYDDTGALRGAGRMPREFDKSAHGLRPIHVRTVAGTVYVCLAAEPPEFDAFHDHLAPMLAGHDLGNAKLAAECTLFERGNWKLVMENARECYHCGAGHPELARSFPTDVRGNFSTAGMVDLPGFIARMEALGLPSAAVQGEWWQASRFPLRDGNVSMTMDGTPCVAKPLCHVNGGDVGSLRWALEPHCFAHAVGDFLIIFSALPLAPQETLVVAKWYVHKDAEEGVDYTRDGLMHVWNETNLQDRALVELNQRGVNSLGYVPGPYSEASESLAIGFTDWYVNSVARRIGAAAPVQKLVDA